MANGYTHAARESTPGNETNTPTLSTKVIFEPVRSVQVQLNPKPMERDDEVRNVDEPLAVLTEAYDPTWSLESRAYPDLLGFELATMLGDPVSTAGNGVITDPDSATVPGRRDPARLHRPLRAGRPVPQDRAAAAVLRRPGRLLQGQGLRHQPVRARHPDQRRREREGQRPRPVPRAHQRPGAHPHL
jgi:hypothetical protein